ncbi:MAG: type II toxin-antitoxin system Phd/YefM family antitoxin [Bacteroidota bacterium]
MTVYTYSQARQRLSAVLDEAQRDGSVRIRRRDGSEFVLTPVEQASSPFEVEGAGLDLTAEEIISAIREGRERS